jgi:hypothetical protein
MTHALAELNPELREYHKQFEGIKQEAADLVAGMSNEQFNWKPAPTRWSVSECLNHINLSDEGLIKAIDKLIDEASSKQLRANGPFKHGMVGSFFVKSMNPPYKMKVKTSADLVPPATAELEQTITRFQKLQDDLLERVQRAAGLNLGAVKLKIAGPIKLTLGQYFGFSASHARRHLWQARQVRALREFPK